MIAPTLLVGLGGTGSKIVCKVSKMITEEQRGRIGFAVFDTDINELREIQEQNPFIKTVQTSTKLSVGEYLNIDTHARDTWFPVNAILNSKTLTEGAGQVRAISRLALDTAIRAGNMEPLHQAIEELYKLEEEQSDQALRVIIVSSLAGGTGSGLILPVALYIRNFLNTRFQQSANITRGFFVLPEVFYEVIRGQSERNNLRCNAYAAIRELDAFLMKGDATLPDKYGKTVKLEFPRVGSSEFEEYPIRPYDFCFLFDAQNTEGKKLNSFTQYLDHAANCIYSQSIGPMNKRSNSSEDNTIRELCAEQGRNRYAGAGTSMLIYPMEDVKEYIALKWAEQAVSEKWLTFDRAYKETCAANAEMRSQGYMVKDVDPAQDYISKVNSMASAKDPFALSLMNQCYTFDESGLTREASKWDIYIKSLIDYIKNEYARGQGDLDNKRETAMQSIGEISGGADVWNAFLDAYHDMEKYRLTILKTSEDTARSAAYAIFKAKNENITKQKATHQLETYLRDEDGNFIHPNAVRYFLYNAYETMLGEKIRIQKIVDEAVEFFERFEKNFDDDKTDEVETAEQLTDRKVSWKTKLTRGLDSAMQDLKAQYSQYMNKADELRVNSVLLQVLVEGIEYIKNLCDAFQSFYYSFESKVANIEKRINIIAKKYDHAPGKTARYVCASKPCLDKLYKQMPYTGSAITIDGKLADDIYSRVRSYSMLTDQPDNNGFFSEIFEKGIIGYFKSKLMATYSDIVNMDILTALEKEVEFEEGTCDQGRIQQYVKHVIAETRKLSNPFIERPLGEQKSPIAACTYNNKLDPRDDSPRSELIKKELGNFGGIPDEDIPLGMIMFYQSIYGLRANKLSKFAPADESGRAEGEYFKAYYELVSQIKPKSDKTPVITPHIDRNWHIISAIPDLDDNNQKAQETRIYKAFMLGLAMDMIAYKPIANNQCRYKLYIKGSDPEDFVVSNKTPCDEFYEVLDALTINPVVVTNILAAADRIFSRELNGTGKIDFENSELKSHLDDLKLDQYKDCKVTIFDLATLLKCSTPSAEFDPKTGVAVMREMLNVVYDYMKSMSNVDELNGKFGEYIYDQYIQYTENFAWYSAQWGDSLDGYIDDIIRVCIEELEDIDPVAYKKVADHRKASANR